MIVEDQSETIAALERPETYGVAGPVERIDTHGAIVFLAGERAYKLKRAVKFPYMDFSSAKRRRLMCEAEIAVNRRTAPDLYLKVLAVTRNRDRLVLGGDGPVVDWLVVMRRFDQNMLLDRLAARGQLNSEMFDNLAAVIAKFHRDAEIMPGFGGFEGVRAIVDGIEQSFGEVSGIFDGAAVAVAVESLYAETERHRKLLEARRAAGLVRRCHGDLHLRNICLVDGQPLLFDAIEFDDAIACIDVLYDLAFLLMDLEYRALRPFANRVFNGYLARAGGHDGLALMPLFMAMRAAIRAHVTATLALDQSAEQVKRDRTNEARAYFDLCRRFWDGPPPVIIAVGGLSGTGKSTLAYALAPDFGRAPGAIVLRSDEIRKEIMGVDPDKHLAEAAYTENISRQVYETQRGRAAAALTAGHAVIADAVFARPGERKAIEDVARSAGIRFHGLWLEAPAEVLESRVEARVHDASDADVSIVRKQSGYDVGAISWARIDAAGEAGTVLRAARAALEPPTE